MKDSGIGPSELARLAKINYQDIQHLQKKDIKRPRYLPELAKAMGTTVEDLIARKMPPPLKGGTTGSREEPEAAPIHEPPTSLSRDEFLTVCANLSTPDWQMTARLMVAAGILQGVVEVTDKWHSKTVDVNSGRPVVRSEVMLPDEKATEPRVGHL